MSLTHFSDPYIENNFNSSQYELLHKIGEGGFGKVYKARNKNTEQTVAIKFLALEPHLEESKKKRYVERFKRETALSGQLEHPHIVRLLDKGQVNEHLLYGVFEYIEGQSLREYLMQEGALDAVEATDIMLQVLDALIHAHKKGIIHRDIKPANIMLSQAGAKTHAKILDFGIGTLTQDSRHQDFATITLTQETIGTPSYSAPEQLRGEPASEKTDLYVWGLVLLECLTGMPAVTGSSIASIYHKQLSDVHIPIPSALLGHPLSGLLRRVLQKNAAERVISGKEAFSELNTMNVSNLVGILADVQAQHGFDDNTVVLRNDDPNNIAVQDYTTLTERKQITVLALRLSAKRLTESAKDFDIIDTLFKSQRNHCIDIATRFGAYHVGNLADTMLFYFGYPVASDNDTRLSARTALDVISELSKRNALMQEAHSIQLNAHIGIHSGIFVTYANSVPEGNIANTAMELARLAGERQILCSAESRAILEPYSDFDYFDNIQIGLSFEQLSIYNLKGEKRVEAFGFMRGTKSHHKLIGRQTELDKTLSVINGENSTRIAHIYGEAGIGKSRLLQEVRDNASQYQHLVAQCLPEHQNSALYPILNLVKYLFNTDNQSVQNITKILVDALTEYGLAQAEIDATVPVLMVWLAIELPEDMQPSSHSPDEQKTMLFAGLSALLLTRKSSISEFKLYIVEDIHWADAITIDFLRYFAAQLQDGSVMISTSRQPCPSSLHDLTLLEVELNKLTAKATTDFIEQLFDSQNVSDNVCSVLVKRTDGIPLFIEELVGMLKEKHLIHERDGAITFISPDRLEQVPSSLRESLQQKLDNLVHAKETAQLAATIGREFEYELLVQASPLSEDQIQNDLNELLERALIVQQRRVDSDSYVFKHALVRDAAYDSASASTRRNMHFTIASSMHKCAKHALEDVAFHYEKAEEYQQAYALNTQAGKAKNKVGLNLLSIPLFERAIEQVQLVAPCEQTFLDEIDLQFTLSMSLAATVGYAHDSVRPHIERALSLCNNLNDPQPTLDVLWGIGITQVVCADHREGIKTADTLYQGALKSNNVKYIVSSLFIKGTILWAMGRFNQSQEVYAKSLSLYDYEKHHQLFTDYPFEVGISSHILQASNCLLLDDYETSEQLVEKANTLASRHNVPACTVHVLARSAYHYVVIKDLEKVQYYAQRCLEISKECNFTLWHAYAEILLNWVRMKSEQSFSISDMHAHLQTYINTGSIGHLSWLKSLYAEALLESAEQEAALANINDAITLAFKQKDYFYLPDSFVIKDKILTALGKPSNYAKKATKLRQQQQVFGKK
ncbi:TOMM system kinase/cyclase fusion protein [Pseudoalteromonas luteoviolacea]|uniref:TOMM system kinase/cyclase fusion protein n=1 Tax=Pseudoalteromonas luteoviolacea TaxID=43657 RepID=UPI0009B8EEDC|nr:TOMM system kinase/cyclase fusion protein [Pseudoalteromonas luteoviolacea]